MSNKNLQTARSAKYDEYYTQLSDIEDELLYYKPYLKDKIIYCNCDNPEKSNFWKYFHLNFSALGLKKLIASYYDLNNPSYVMVYGGGIDSNLRDGTKFSLAGNGDFRSEECVSILKQSDIVVTNPPFSLFREYVTQLMEYDKKFIIVGNQNAITYKTIFPYIKKNIIRIGFRSLSNHMFFYVTKDHEKYLLENRKCDSSYKIINGEVLLWNNSNWFTNFDIIRCHEKLVTGRSYYNPLYQPVGGYHKFDNYDAINVDRTMDIPDDYYGEMGVPITFMDKYNMDQFQLIGHAHDENGDGGHGVPKGNWYVNRKIKYNRILIKRR